MFDPFKKLKLAGAFLGVADDAAAAAGDNIDISELFGRLSIKDLRAMTLQPEALLELPGVRNLFETKYMPPPEPLERLVDMGEGTLGYEFVRYLRQHKLPQPQLPRRADYNDAATYLTQRVRMTHAMLHVVTEYDASPLGELALQAYYIGQLGNLISGVIISSAILQIIRDTPELLGPALEVTSEAFQRGKEARTFLGMPWEELWSAQVPQLRELIGIPPRTSAVAQLRLEGPATPPGPTDTRNRSGSFSSTAFAGNEDGLAALGRMAGSSSSSSSSSSSGNNSTPKPSQPRVFSGFNSTPVPDDPPRREPSAPEPRPRTSSTSAASSSLLASFMALAEQAQQPEPSKPEPRPEPRTMPPPPPPSRPSAAAPPRIEPRPPGKTPPLPVAAKPAPAAQPPEPTYKVEEPAKHVTPALSPDDPDYF